MPGAATARASHGRTHAAILGEVLASRCEFLFFGETKRKMAAAAQAADVDVKGLLPESAEFFKEVRRHTCINGTRMLQLLLLPPQTDPLGRS